MNDSTTAVVLAAGRGTRMQRGTGGGLDRAQEANAARGLKAMIPDARGRPFLDHVLASLADAGVIDVCIVVRADDDAVQQHYLRCPPRRVRITFAAQAVPRGTADALLATESWCARRDLIVLNADNLYPVAAIHALVTLGAPGLIAFDRTALVVEGNIDAARIAAFATVTLGPGDALEAIVEKPQSVAPQPSPWISMNLWRFDAGIFDLCRDVEPSPRGEWELPLAVGLGVQRGMIFRAIRLHAGVLDLSSRDDVAAVSRLLGDREIVP